MCFLRSDPESRQPHAVRSPRRWGLLLSLMATCLGLGTVAPVTLSAAESSELSDERVDPDELDHMGVPAKPPLTLALGNTFLGQGEIFAFELPTGAVWQPSLLLFGTLRTAFQSFDNGRFTTTEWANRLDLNANVQLTGTERFFLGFRPLNNKRGFTGYTFEPDGIDGWDDGLNFDVTSLFFEGDFGEIFPFLDPEDEHSLDYGITVGRAPHFYQEGMLINDFLDSVAITRNTVLPNSTSNLRVTGLYAWSQIHRRDRALRRAGQVGPRNRRDGDAHLLAILTELDTSFSTFNFDLVGVIDEGDRDGDAIFTGISAVQRIGPVNTAFRINSSMPISNESTFNRFGTLIFGEASITPTKTDNILYWNAFWGIEEFHSAARDPTTGGPLGRTGILFAAVGLGRYGAALGNDADNVVGSAVGYQMFFDGTRRQIIVEVGGRTPTKGGPGQDASVAIGARIQQAFLQNFIVQADAFVGGREGRDVIGGARIELLMKF